MTGRSGRCVPLRARRAGAFAGCLFLLGVALSGVPASAQTASSTVSQTPEQKCRVFSVATADSQVQDLRASCGGRGLMLGSATGYEVIANDSLKATAVDVRLGSDRRILLITIQDDGMPLVEDLTGDLAIAAGRGPMSHLSGLDIDFGQFATDGSVAVRPAAGDTSHDKRGQVSAALQIAVERGRRQGAATRD